MSLAQAARCRERGVVRDEACVAGPAPRRFLEAAIPELEVARAPYDVFEYVSVRVVEPPPDSRSSTTVSVPPPTVKMSLPKLIACF